MLRSINQLYGNKLGATDGERGRVRDFYFDDQNWAIGYLVVDTNTWLPKRQVLRSPYSLGLDQPDVPGAELDRKLRSAQAVTGYQVRTPAGEVIGHVCDFVMDAGSWGIGQLVIKTGHRLSGAEELIPTKRVDRISYEECTVFVRSESDAVPSPGFMKTRRGHSSGAPLEYR